MFSHFFLYFCFVVVVVVVVVVVFCLFVCFLFCFVFVFVFVFCFCCCCFHERRSNGKQYNLWRWPDKIKFVTAYIFSTVKLSPFKFSC